MEKVDIIIQIEVGRLKALDFFLFDKQKSSLKAELEKAADALYEKYVDLLRKQYGFEVGTGEFGADMQINLTNDGPVTIIIDSKNK